VAALQDMGFTRDAAQRALAAAGLDVEAALARLLDPT
jgi:uncharacterized UBP type Zn finger protein